MRLCPTPLNPFDINEKQNNILQLAVQLPGLTQVCIMARPYPYNRITLRLRELARSQIFRGDDEGRLWVFTEGKGVAHQEVRVRDYPGSPRDDMCFG
jgi:hypothetical protein